LRQQKNVPETYGGDAPVEKCGWGGVGPKGEAAWGGVPRRKKAWFSKLKPKGFSAKGG